MITKLGSISGRIEPMLALHQETDAANDEPMQGCSERGSRIMSAARHNSSAVLDMAAEICICLGSLRIIRWSLRAHLHSHGCHRMKFLGRLRAWISVVKLSFSFVVKCVGVWLICLAGEHELIIL
jgi:hypothetical protein